jgi:hypothetical protein
MRTRVLLTALLIVGAVSAGFTRQGRPDSVSGTITRTFSIVANTDLTGTLRVTWPTARRVFRLPSLMSS